jgi:hypothetical protein
MLGSTAALIVTSPLLSPQFLIWLTPWAALVATRAGGRLNAPLVLTLGAATITGLTLAVFGPPNLARLAPALALTVRNGMLLWLPVSCWRWLDRIDRGSAG